MKSKNTKVLVVAGIVLALVLAGCSSLGYFGWQYLKNNTAVLAGQPSEEAGAEEATAPAEPVDNGEATEIAASNMMSYEDYVAGAPEGFSVVEIEGTYTYALNVSIKNGQRIYKWYEAFPATNHDANGYQYASGYATGDFVPASEVMSHWTQVTLLTVQVTKIDPENMMSYEDYVAGAPEGFSVVEIEGTYTYALNVSIKNGQRIYKWYEAFPATNHDANGYQYASGYATGDFVPASEVMSHWTQVTIITAEPTLIQP